ncbi:MAG: hypothetical protein CMJ50_05570 [Planctomycetaceae bacterium]|nr:hypothetical protein [Planctomycetaceae bacterium]
MLKAIGRMSNQLLEECNAIKELLANGTQLAAGQLTLSWPICFQQLYRWLSCASQSCQRQNTRNTTMFELKNLYHFTQLLCLPRIMSEGIKGGEVPVLDRPYNRRPKAVNLTRNPDPKAQGIWNVGPTDKSRVRFLVDLPADEIIRFKEACRQHKIRASWIKILAPGGEHFDWFFYDDVIPVERIRRIDVALEHGGPLEMIQGHALDSLIEIVEAEVKEKLRFGIDRDGGEIIGMASHEDSWLLDGPELRRAPPTCNLRERLSLTTGVPGCQSSYS